MDGNFDADHLQSIHRYLFQDVFPWAGQFRVVGISKPGGAPFAVPMYIESALATVLLSLKKEHLLAGLGLSSFLSVLGFI